MYITCTEYNYTIAYNAMCIRITTTHRVIDVGIGGNGEIGGCVRVGGMYFPSLGGRYFPPLITKCTHDNPICWLATQEGKYTFGLHCFYYNPMTKFQISAAKETNVAYFVLHIYLLMLYF